MSRISIAHLGGGALSISGMDSLNVHHTLRCGQAFRWHQVKDGYTGVVKGHLLRVSQGEGTLRVEGYPQEGLAELVVEYFDLEKEYREIERRVAAMDLYLARAVAFGRGLRLLRQDPWECLISFIISARNNIPCIMRSIEAMAERYGDRVELECGSYYTFPTPAQLASADPEDLMGCGMAFRAKYIVETARRVLELGIDLQELRQMETREARAFLMEFKGVGEKVADCVLLFGLQKYEAFPIDVWINRVMRDLYFGGREVSLRKMQEYAQGRFGEYAGYAQEYLYYWARSGQPIP